jgi:hypothetical protein
LSDDDRSNASAADGYGGRGFLYALPVAGPEDLLKVGMSHDPLARWSAFHARWFEAFDLERSLLVETETRGDARRLETALHRMLAAHRCPMPITMREQAGGGGEWYRGADVLVRAFVDEQAARGFVVHHDAMPWLAARMRQQQDRLEGLLRQAREDEIAGWLAPAQHRALRDLLDAHRHFDPGLAAKLPADVLEALGLAG